MSARVKPRPWIVTSVEPEGAAFIAARDVSTGASYVNMFWRVPPRPTIAAETCRAKPPPEGAAHVNEVPVDHDVVVHDVRPTPTVPV